jgi:hypothetical protein
MIMEFIKSLFRSRIEGAEVFARGKAYGAQARAKGKIASKFNKIVDAPMNKAKGLAKKGQEKFKKPKEKKGMGWFFKKKETDDGYQDAPPSEEEMKTVAINIEGFADQKGQECVGWIVVMSGTMKGKDFRLVNGKNVIGSAADCDIVITDSYLSSHHATIRFDDGIYIFKDLDSTNGTYVNGKKINSEQIVDNDTLRVGRTELRFKALY